MHPDRRHRVAHWAAKYVPRVSIPRVLGRWRMIEMDMWDRDAMDLVGPAMIEFGRDGTGSFRFIAVHARLDFQAAEDNASGRVDFTWEGFDEGDHVSGRGWAAAGDDGALAGHRYFHMGDESGFSAVRWDER